MSRPGPSSKRNITGDEDDENVVPGNQSSLTKNDAVSQRNLETMPKKVKKEDDGSDASNVVEQEKASTSKSKFVIARKEDPAVARRKLDEVDNFIKNYEFRATDYPANSSPLLDRFFFEVDNYTSRNSKADGVIQPDALVKCIFCKEGSNVADLVSCHGYLSGEKSGAERIPVEKRPFRSCPSRFHLECIMNYTAGSFYFQYAARRECQGRLLCPLHCCNSCNLSHAKQSAYQPDLIECALCLRAFHLETCYPAGATDVDVTIKIDGGKPREFEMMICPAHCYPTKKKGDSSQDENIPIKAIDRPVVIKNHIPRCINIECKLRKKKLTECKMCVRSFHAECREVKTIDKKPVPSDVCEFCIANDDIHKNTPVLALWTQTNKFFLAKTIDWYLFPNKQREKSSNFEKAGYTVVQWLFEDKPPTLSIMPIYLIAPLTEPYISLADQQLQNFWRKTFDDYNDTSLKRCPPVLKQVSCTINRSKYLNKEIRPKPVSDETLICRCTDEPRCTTNSCSFRADNFECPPECEKIGAGCSNRNISKGFVNPKLFLKVTENKGYGLFTKEDIKSGEFLAEYVGEIIDKVEKKKRLDIVAYSRDQQANMYIMDLRDGFAIDASAYGNVSRYINHSCDPNSEPSVTHIFTGRQKGVSLFEPRTEINAIKDIAKDSEITFAYQISGHDSSPVCYCASSNCDGFMTYKPPMRTRDAESSDSEEEDEEESTDDEKKERASKKTVAKTITTVIKSKENKKKKMSSKEASGSHKKPSRSSSRPADLQSLPTRRSGISSSLHSNPSPSSSRNTAIGRKIQATTRRT